jgi:transcriptional regulator GlxA family with amidase domain
MTTLIDIVVFDGLDELDALGPMEVFRTADDFGARLTARLVTRTPQDLVTGAHGLRFAPDGVLESGRAEIVVVPGGGWGTRAETGAWAEVQRGDLLEVIRAAAEGARIVAGVCTGTMLLAHAGLVGARRVSTHRSALAATGATVLPERVVDDGDLVTSGGVSSGIDMALWIVERECGAELADRVSDHMEYPRTRPVGVLDPATA